MSDKIPMCRAKQASGKNEQNTYEPNIIIKAFCYYEISLDEK